MQQNGAHGVTLPTSYAKNHEKRGFLPARIEKWPHKSRNGRTDGKMARTKREIARTD
jgi:hypothetical protein